MEFIHILIGSLWIRQEGKVRLEVERTPVCLQYWLWVFIDIFISI